MPHVTFTYDIFFNTNISRGFRKREMRALSLTQEQRGYYHATLWNILLVTYVFRIPSTLY